MMRRIALSKRFAWVGLGVALAITSGVAAQFYNFFPPPGLGYVTGQIQTTAYGTVASPTTTPFLAPTSQNNPNIPAQNTNLMISGVGNQGGGTSSTCLFNGCLWDSGYGDLYYESNFTRPLWRLKMTNNTAGQNGGMGILQNAASTGGLIQLLIDTDASTSCNLAPFSAPTLPPLSNAIGCAALMVFPSGNNLLPFCLAMRDPTASNGDFCVWDFEINQGFLATAYSGPVKWLQWTSTGTSQASVTLGDTNAASVTNIVGGSTANTQANGSPILTQAAGATNIQTFTATGANTWTKPAGTPKVTRVILCGAGGGGGSGARVTLGTAESGGGSGGGGTYDEITIPTANLGATETVTIGTGGTAGAALTVNGAGNAGGIGGTTSFGTWLSAFGGGGGSGGGNATNNSSGGGGGSCISAGSTGAIGAGGGGAFGSGCGNGATGGSNGLAGTQFGTLWAGGAGSGDTNSAAGQLGGATTLGGSGGGAGGGLSTTTAFAGGASGATSLGSGVTGGAVATTGGNGSAPTAQYQCGSGGAGGGGNTAGLAGSGGNGAQGGGGGGGGASAGGNSGAGGAGGNGFAAVITTY